MSAITYIDDIINETPRLRLALMTGRYCVTPAQGIQVDEVHIPSNVNVFIPVQVIHTDERYYQEAELFFPERGGERNEGMGAGQASAFYRWIVILGLYSCAGKNLATMTLRIAISIIAQQYNISFAPGETGEAFEQGALDTFTTTFSASAGTISASVDCH
ncbi:hypothetical protein ETB97_008739 [Aspergillus alliaceus]|uniref:Cytochrome P450 n=1 Tax=Petromyces alliaceus TaxID=209559 RepID=A0A8H6ACJ1_PETAA|nr:hypothetical protein ETB97_008739 [Aspergillus burnettii]